MDQINCYEQYRQTVSAAKQNGWHLTNCFFLPAAARKKAETGRLLTVWLEAGLLLLEDEGTFYRCFYFLPETGVLSPVTLDKPAVAEFPFNGTLREKQTLQIEKLEALGFRLGRESALMQANPAQPTNPEVSHSEVSGAIESDVPAVLALFRVCFNPLYSFLPDTDELTGAVRDGRVFVVRRSGRVLGALFSDFEKGIASIRQVAVAADGRGMGLGKALVCAYHRHYLETARGFQHWVDVHNTPAVDMYRQFGYSFSLRRANEYIMERRYRHERSITRPAGGCPPRCGI